MGLSPPRVPTVRASRVRVEKSPVDHVLGEATDSVAAHLGGRAVGVVVGHEVVGRTGSRTDEDESVGPDPEVTVTDPRDGIGREVEFSIEILDHDEVVAEPVHLREVQFHARRSPLGGPVCV